MRDFYFFVVVVTKAECKADNPWDQTALISLSCLLLSGIKSFKSADLLLNVCAVPGPKTLAASPEMPGP